LVYFNGMNICHEANRPATNYIVEIKDAPSLFFLSLSALLAKKKEPSIYTSFKLHIKKHLSKVSDRAVRDQNERRRQEQICQQSTVRISKNSHCIDYNGLLLDDYDIYSFHKARGSLH
jgi:hypothetical protein